MDDFSNKVMKMREHGRPLKKATVKVAKPTKATPEAVKPTKKAVTKNADTGADRKSALRDSTD